jgi:ADP-ribosyl-[dinitrogen reductase] hydrolase
MAAVEMIDRFRGCLVGLATGDALGTPLEFLPPSRVKPISGMVGGGPFALQPGQWTDDTSMALCLAESLVECRGFDAQDQMRRYVRWYRTGHLSSIGKCFDIGGTTRRSLEQFEKTGDPISGPTAENTAGNGSIMRLGPVPLFYCRSAKQAVARAAESSRTTHGARNAVDACRYLSGLIWGALNAASKSDLLDGVFSPFERCWEKDPVAPEIAEIAAGSFRRKQPPEIAGTGYVVRSLEAALWAFHRTESFRDGCLAAVNLGDDADTTGAVFGQIAGAYYGLTAIPAPWLKQLAKRSTIDTFAKKLFAATASRSSKSPD